MSEKTENKYVPVLHTPVQIKPKDGKQVRKEDGTYLAETGDTVNYTTYWERRRIDEDIDIIGPGVIEPVEEPAPVQDQKNGKSR